MIKCTCAHLFQHYPIAILLTFKKRIELQALIDFGGRYIYHDSHEKTNYNRICSKQMDRTMKQFILKMATIVLSFVIATLAPMFAYFLYGTRSTTLETHIPCVEAKSDTEYYICLFLQNIFAMHGFPSYIGLECFLSILQNVVTATPQLIRNELKHTIQLYKEKAISELELRIRLGNIVKQSNDLDK